MIISESRNDRHRRSGDRAAADHLRDRDNAAGIGDNSSEIGDNYAEIGDNAAARRDRRYRRESDPIINSVLNGDWSNSVPGRQFPKGPRGSSSTRYVNSLQRTALATSHATASKVHFVLWVGRSNSYFHLSVCKKTLDT